MPKEKDELLSGKYYTDAKNKVDLIKRLTALSSHLKDKEQDEEVAKSLQSVAAALVSPTVLSSKDKDVRLLVACALADIIRLFAPDAPYNDEQLKKIFSLFIEQLRGLEKPRDPAYTKVFYLLEKLAVVKAFILLVELDDDLLVELFKLFFAVVSLDHSPKAVSYMKDVMCACLDEASMISQALLDAVLSHILPSKDSADDAAQKLAQSTVVQSATRFQNPILQFLSDVISGARSTDSDLKDRAHDIIYELYRVAPITVADVLPQLEGELKVDDDAVRKSAIELLGRVFSEKGAVLGPLRALLYAWAGRLTDKKDELRLLTLRHLRAVLLAHPELLQDEEIVKHLTGRLRDGHEGVRREALPAVCEVAAAAPERLPEEHIRECLDRLRDKKPAVRIEAVHQLARLYAALDLRYGSDEWPSAVEQRFGALPRRLLQSYVVEDVAGRCALEEALDVELLGDGTAEQRAEGLVRLVQRLDRDAVLSFQRMLTDKKRVQTDFLALLELRKNKVEAPDEAAQKMAQIAGRLPGPLERTVSALSHLDFRHEPVLLRALQQLARPELRYADSKQAKTNALHSSKDSAVYQKLIQRLSSTLLNVDFIPVLLRAASVSVPQTAASQQSLEELQRTQHRTSLLLFLERAAGVHPGLFRGSTAVLREWIRGADVELIDGALALFARGGTLLDLGSHAADLKKQFLGFATEGTARQAKLAVRALVSADPQHSEDNLRVLLKKLGGSSFSGAPVEAVRLPANLSARTQLASSAPHLFRTVADACVDFVKQLLLQSNRGDAATKLLGLKLLVRGSIRLQNADLARLVQKILLGLIKTQGDASEDKSASEAEKDLLRKYALSGSLALARHFDAFVSPTDFLQLVWACNDSSAEVREHVLQKLHKYSSPPSPLPVRYFAVFGWFGAERHRPLAIKARQLFESAVRLRRELIRSVSATAPLDPRHSAALLPEYALPYLVYAVAYRPDFAVDREQQSLRSTAALVHFFLAHIRSNENQVFVDQLLRYIKSADNANSKLDPLPYRVVCDVALKVHHQRADNRKWTANQVHQNQIYLPPAFFRVEPQREIKEEISYLPAGWQPDLRRQSVVRGIGEDTSEAAVSPDRSSPLKRKQAATPKSAGKKRSKKSKTTENGNEEDEAVDLESDSEALPKALARASPSRARARAVADAIRSEPKDDEDELKGKKKQKKAEEEEEEDEEDEPKAVHQRKKKKN